ncbi:hypothetical protein [Desulfobacter vibrioformis]|uniref:hypothetical protein n=1 Tax=Desulfobacter vibrioformis TaxID=34031 RepID=UPI000550471B|nr:hypothetical protein [Desulfobacter vibrioformis]
MRLPLVKAETQTDFVAVLERKMIRIRALLNELNRMLDAEYEAGMAYDSKSLKKLILRKQNSVNRFEHLVRAMDEQLSLMAGREMPSARPGTLVNWMTMIPGLTRRQKDVLFPLARDLEQRHLDLMKTARRNGVLFKNALDRMSVASKYINQGKVIVP